MKDSTTHPFDRYMDGQWHRTSPIAIVYFVGKSIRVLWEQFKILILPNTFLLAWFAATANWLGFMIVSLPWVVVIMAIVFVRYFRFKFRLRSDSLSIRQGVFKLEHVEIHFARVRAFGLRRSLIDRLFGLAQITCDTAGTNVSEATLPAVSFRWAQELSEHVKTGQFEESVTTERPTEDSTPSLSKVLVSLGWREIIQVGLTRINPVILIGTSFIAFLGITVQLMVSETHPILGLMFIYSLHESLEPLIGRLGIVILLAVEVFLLILVFYLLASTCNSYLKWFGFTLKDDTTSLSGQAGFTKRHDVSIEVSKIQGVRIRQNVRQRLLNFFTVSCKQTGALADTFIAEDQEFLESQNLIIPYVDQKAYTSISRVIFGKASSLNLEIFHQAYSRISPTYYWINVGRDSLITLFGTYVLWQLFQHPLVIYFVLIVPLLLGIHLLRWLKLGIHYDDGAIVYRHGMFGYILDVMKFSKVQSVDVTQSFIQRWTNRASFTIHNAVATIRIPYMTYQSAIELRDFVLTSKGLRFEPWE